MLIVTASYRVPGVGINFSKRGLADDRVCHLKSEHFDDVVRFPLSTYLRCSDNEV